MAITHNICVLDFPLMLWVNMPFVDRIHPQSNNFVTGLENKATGDSDLNGSLDVYFIQSLYH